MLDSLGTRFYIGKILPRASSISKQRRCVFFRLRLESLRRSCGVDDVEVIRRVRNGKEWEIVVVRDDQVNESENTRAFVTMLPMMISAVLFALSEERKKCFTFVCQSLRRARLLWLARGFVVYTNI